MATVPLYHVDAFSDRPFGGNPAAVCIVDDDLTAETMQHIAAEMNLSETAFTGLGPGGDRWLRWFTPTMEVPLCGHATLAASHVLFQAGEASPIRYSSLSGTLTVHREGSDSLRMDFPADPPSLRAAPEGLHEALGTPPGAPVLAAAMTWVVRLDAWQEVAALSPDFGALGRVDLRGGLGVSVTAPGPEGTDFRSRFFAPWAGVDEDPVTGLAHTALGPYWAEQTGRTEFAAEQISKRGGRLRVRVDGDRVYLSGQAVTVARGELLLPAADGARSQTAMGGTVS